MRKEFAVQKTILILTHSLDDSAQLVIDKLIEKKCSFTRFNTDLFHQEIRIKMQISDSGFVGSYVFPDKEVNFNEVGIVWNRRVHFPNYEDWGLLDDEMRVWAEEETTAAMNNSFTLLNCPIVNPFVINEKLKFNKLIQMNHAQSLGFSIPKSCVTNNPSEVRNFWESVNKRMVCKKIKYGLTKSKNDGVSIFHTTEIPEGKFTDELIDRMRFWPVFLQELIPKKVDIRSVVVGERVFSFAIHSQNVPNASVDYRKAAVLGYAELLRHEPIHIGEENNKRLIKFTKDFGLSFGVFDLVLTPEDEIFFLEDNPNGQWGWLEERTGVPISREFANFLMENKT